MAYMTIGSVQRFWHKVDNQIPPNELLEVKDKDGKTAKANPVYLSFKVDENGNIMQCEPYWDGSWMIECEFKDGNIITKIDTIVAWRFIS